MPVLGDAPSLTPARAAPRLAYTYALGTGVTLPEPTVKTVPVDVYADINSDWVKTIAKAYGFAAGAQPFIGLDAYSLSGKLTAGGMGRLEVEQFSGFTTFWATYDTAAVRLAPSASTATNAARAFLSDAGQLAPNLKPAQTYERTSKPGILYVEFQRDWTPLPILEVGGMLEASIDMEENVRPRNADIVRTSDDMDGLYRLGDFNTATIGVDARGRIVSAVVHTRPIASTLPARTVKPASDAWAALQAGKGILGLTLPTEGMSASAWNAMFPNGEARSTDARVSEVILAYAEKGAGELQTYLQPVYIFRGTATLAGGKTAPFVIAVPALADDALPTPSDR